MIIKEYKKEYKDYFMFITVHHSMIEVSVYSYTNDDFEYKQKFIDFSAEEVYELICEKIDFDKLEEVA
tara:strand:- start:335 stop:538 length:204 start_codon:yes stop_codon:yes gene_type:complete